MLLPAFNICSLPQLSCLFSVTWPSRAYLEAASGPRLASPFLTLFEAVCKYRILWSCCHWLRSRPASLTRTIHSRSNGRLPVCVGYTSNVSTTSDSTLRPFSSKQGRTAVKFSVKPSTSNCRTKVVFGSRDWWEAQVCRQRRGGTSAARWKQA